MADQDQIDSEMMGQPIMTDPGHPFTFNREVPMPQQTYEQITAPMRSERKQNSACDACRLRKVKCFKQPGEEKCQHCKAKKLECTRYYVTLASSYSNKRGTKRTRAPATEGSSKFELCGRKSARLEQSSTVPASFEFKAGKYVQVRRTEKGDLWSEDPHKIVQVIYKPVAVILDDEKNAAISIDLVRPYIQPTNDGPPPASSHTQQQPQDPNSPEMPGLSTFFPPTQMQAPYSQNAEPYDNQNIPVPQENGSNNYGYDEHFNA